MELIISGNNSDKYEEYKAYREQLRKVIDDLLAGGKIKLLWHKN